MFKDMKLEEYLNSISSKDPVPGGGTTSAISGATAASLIAMVAGLTAGKKGYEDSWETMEEIRKEALNLKEELISLSEKDSESYQAVFNCFKMPKETDEEKAKRSEAIQKATLEAALIPLSVAEISSQLFKMAKIVVEKGNKNAVSDGACAALLARSAVRGAALNVKINLSSLKDEKSRNELAKKVESYINIADKSEAEILQLTGL